MLALVATATAPPRHRDALLAVGAVGAAGLGAVFLATRSKASTTTTTPPPDPCVGITCPTGETCANGRCSCNGAVCTGGQVCLNGVCGNPTCAGVTCPPGQTCVAGQCVSTVTLPAVGTVAFGTPSSAVYVIAAGPTKRHIANGAAYQACGYTPGQEVLVPDSTLAQIPNGPDITGPPDCPSGNPVTVTLPAVGTVAFGTPSQAIYVIAAGPTKRHIANGAAYQACGYTPGQEVLVPDSTLAQIPNGPDITGPPDCPSGHPVTDPCAGVSCPAGQTCVGGQCVGGTVTLPVGTVAFGTPSQAIYVIAAGPTKRHIASGAAWTACGYQPGQEVTVPDATLAQIPNGPDITGPPDCPSGRPTTATLPAVGTVAFGTPSGAIYVIAAGPTKRHIANGAAWTACGYQPGQEVLVDDSTLALIPNGPDITGPPDCPSGTPATSGPVSKTAARTTTGTVDGTNLTPAQINAYELAGVVITGTGWWTIPQFAALHPGSAFAQSVEALGTNTPPNFDVLTYPPGSLNPAWPYWEHQYVPLGV